MLKETIIKDQFNEETGAVSPAKPQVSVSAAPQASGWPPGAAPRFSTEGL